MNIPGWHWGHFGGAVMLVLAATTMQAAVAQDAPETKTAVDAARQMLARQDYAAALNTLDGLLDKRPDNGEARFLKGLALARGGKNDDALALFEALSKDFPNMADAWNNLGVLRARDGNLEGARAALEKAAAVDPEHVAAQQNLGDVYVALARQAYLDVGALAPDNATAETKSRKLAALMRSNATTIAANAADGAQALDAQSGNEPASEQKRETTTQASTQIAGVDNSILAGDSVNAGSVSSPETAAAATSAAGNEASANARKQSPETAVRAALQRWAKAWSAQDLDAYFAAYDDDFHPADGLTMQQWRALRVRRVGGPDSIQVKLSHIEVTLTGADSAMVHFEQAYQSDRYQDDVHKTVTLEQGPKGWLITSES